MRHSRTSGSVGALGGQPPRATRPKLDRTKSGMKAAVCLEPEPCRSAELPTIARAEEWMGRLHRRRLEAGIVYKEFPARRNEFPVPEHWESVAMTASRLGNLGPDAARRV